MTITAKVKWEDVTKWIARIGVGVIGVFSAFAFQVFNETRDDVKTLLKQDAAHVERVNGIELRVQKAEVEIDKLRDAK